MTHPYTLLYILGSGHCGSTLLDLMLNGHPSIFGMGEIVDLKKEIKLSKEIRDSSPRILDISLWKNVKQHYECVSGMSFEELNTSHPRWRIGHSWKSEDVQRWAQPSKILLSCIHQISGAKILVDTSKFPHRLYLLQRSGFFNIKVIHMLRDGRAVINSYVRKYGNFGLALRRWLSPTLLAFYIRRQFAPTDWLQLRYEDLATRPETVLKSICVFLGINFAPTMLAYRAHQYAGVGGNRMRNGDDDQVFLDERWKQEMSRKHRLLFAVIAGWLNTLYGY